MVDRAQARHGKKSTSGMDHQALASRIADAFPSLSPQLQQAARHVLDRPDDVALMSMRGLAAKAGVHPSTMMRLAQAFRYAGFNAFRQPFQRRLKSHPPEFLARARNLQALSGSKMPALVEDVLAAGLGNLSRSFEVNGAEKFIACADALAAGRRLFMVGLRGCYPVAFFFHYVYGMFRTNGVLLDAGGGAFADDLRAFGAEDVMFAVSVDPYTHETVLAAEYAKDHGGTTVVLTDSLASPLIRNADHALIIEKDSPSFFHSVAPALTVAEALLALMVARGGRGALDAIAESEHQLRIFDAYWTRPAKGRRGGGPGAGNGRRQ